MTSPTQPTQPTLPSRPCLILSIPGSGSRWLRREVRRYWPGTVRIEHILEEEGRCSLGSVPEEIFSSPAPTALLLSPVRDPLLVLASNALLGRHFTYRAWDYLLALPSTLVQVDAGPEGHTRQEKILAGALGRDVLLPSLNWSIDRAWRNRVRDLVSAGAALPHGSRVGYWSRAGALEQLEPCVERLVARGYWYSWMEELGCVPNRQEG
jgi:hypothetical protein